MNNSTEIKIIKALKNSVNESIPQNFRISRKTFLNIIDSEITRENDCDNRIEAKVSDINRLFFNEFKKIDDNIGYTAIYKKWQLSFIDKMMVIQKTININDDTKDILNNTRTYKSIRVGLVGDIMDKISVSTGLKLNIMNDKNLTKEHIDYLFKDCNVDFLINSIASLIDFMRQEMISAKNLTELEKSIENITTIILERKQDKEKKLKDINCLVLESLFNTIYLSMIQMKDVDYHAKLLNVINVLLDDDYKLSWDRPKNLVNIIEKENNEYWVGFSENHFQIYSKYNERIKTRGHFWTLYADAEFENTPVIEEFSKNILTRVAHIEGCHYLMIKFAKEISLQEKEVFLQNLKESYDNGFLEWNGSIRFQMIKDQTKGKNQELAEKFMLITNQLIREFDLNKKLEGNIQKVQQFSKRKI